MPCLCTANTLRVFIRNVAQIDLSAAAPRIAPVQLQKGAVRNFTATRASPLQSSTPRRFESVSPSVFSPVRGTKNAEGSRIPGEHLKGPGHRHEQYTAESDGQRSNSEDVDLDSVIADFSPEAIDALAAESNSGELSSYAESQYEETAWKPRNDTTPVEPRFRRTKVQNTGLAIHLSSPRASIPRPSSGNSSYPKKDRTEFRDYRQEPGGFRSQDGGRDGREKAPRRTTDDWTPPKKENWMIQKAALKEKFKEPWNGAFVKRLSPDALAGIRALHAQMPEVYNTATLAEYFKVSPEAIRRILKSKWTPKQDEEIDRQRRWFKRGEKVWNRWAAEEGRKPPSKFRTYGKGEWKMVSRGERQTKQWVPATLTSETSASSRGSELPLSTRRSDATASVRPDTIPWG